MTKRNVYIYILLVAGMFFLLTSCNKKEYPETPFSTVQVKKSVKLLDNASPLCTFDMKFAYANGTDKRINEAINKTLVKEIFDEDSLSPKAAVDSFIVTYSGLYRTQTATLYRNDVKNSDTDKWYSFYYTLNTKTEEGNDSVICYKSDFERFEGGPQAYHVKRWLNFNKETGRLMTLDSILKSGYEPALSALLLRKLMEKYNLKDENAVHSAGFLNNAEMYPSANYMMKDHAIVFLYNASEIAPQTMGETELTIGLDDLEDWLKHN